jgi:hypothetical protein
MVDHRFDAAGHRFHYPEPLALSKVGAKDVVFVGQPGSNLIDPFAHGYMRLKPHGIDHLIEIEVITQILNFYGNIQVIFKMMSSNAS